MFCSSCGFESVIGKFCSQCGKELAKEDAPPMSIDDFYQNKSKERSNRFCKSKKKPYKKTDLREVEQTTIYIALAREVCGEIQTYRGKSLPVKVQTDWGPYDLKTAACEKHCRYNPSLKGKSKTDFRLTYKSGETVKYIPGTETPFTIKLYKEDLGVGYSRITLYLIEYEYFDDDDDDDDQFRCGFFL